ncbi:MAG: aldo/keto reductase [Actinomycetia bacterium]|nr:aldo/keto reductase [Actinomycetes bacterium]
MKTVTLPQTDLCVPVLIAGMMRIRDLDDKAIRALVDAALAEGVTFFDHADIYGGETHLCERRFADALRLSTSQRDGMVLQSKCGIVPSPRGTYYDFSHDHIIEAVEGSLRALRTDYLDILLLHRPDTLVEPDEVARAFDELEAAGKVRHFGVSNHTPGQIELLRSVVRSPLIVNQVQLSLTHAPLVAQGLAANIAGEPQSVSRDVGLLDYARLHGITLQAWSPFQNPGWTGTFLGNDANVGLNAALARLATAYGVTPTGIATAWLTRHPAAMQVVIGTTSPQHLRAAAAGVDVMLSRPEWYELFAAAGHAIP